jgi:hypothetical protein
VWRHSVSTRPEIASFEQDARIVLPVGGSITPRENHVDGAKMKDTNDGHRHLRFLSHHILNIQCTSVQQYSFTMIQ